MYQWKGLGLSAVQVGRPIQLMVINTMSVDKENGRKLTICNPVIIDKSGDFTYNEGCLSFPGFFIPNTRTNELTIEFQGLDGEKRTEKLVGVTAFCFQHEYDHFYGKTIDKLNK